MGIFVILASLGTLAISVGAGDMMKGGCEDVVDIYASRDQYQYTESDCPYTKTLVCDTCPNYAVKRVDYDDWAQQFYEYGLNPPYPRRTDTDRIYRKPRES